MAVKNPRHRWLKWEDRLLLDLCGPVGTPKNWIMVEATMKIPASRCKSRYHQLTRRKDYVRPVKLKVVKNGEPQKQPKFWGHNIGENI